MYIHVHIHLCKYMYMYIEVNVCICTYMYMYMYVCMYMYLYMNVDFNAITIEIYYYRLGVIIEVTGATTYHGFLPTLVRDCVAAITRAGEYTCSYGYMSYTYLHCIYMYVLVL